MSIYGYLNCHDCCQTLWLGKALNHGHSPSACFHIGTENDLPHWARTQLNQVLWKFLAEHTGHGIDVRLEHEMTDEMWGYREIGGDTDEGISFEAYLAGWPGLAAGGSLPEAEPGAAPDTAI
ncbi:hypothetical protein R5W23_005707 [Gemmata sp. JC673]|uniref:Uncharacterized protein n=1 Tax=Gemmata algarum TaxID=2975278 RepID=A0ABU5EU07_9BACT|nr:hypothetical protein [Gemmata algarum]MDY3558586.1 hypothetical protein [Gemmata algarum]